MDYKKLLTKYMTLIDREESSTYLSCINDAWSVCEVEFTDEEKKELKEIESNIK